MRVDHAQAVEFNGVAAHVVGPCINHLRKCMHVSGWVCSCSRETAAKCAVSPCVEWAEYVGLSGENTLWRMRCGQEHLGMVDWVN